MKTKLVVLLTLCFSLSLMAEGVKTNLIIWAKDGSKIVYPLSSRPKVTFSDTDLTVTTNGLEAVFNLEDMARFTYESSDYDKCTIVLTNPMATYCSPLDLDFSSVNGLKAYIASSFDSETGVLTMTRINDVPAGTGVLLIGQTGIYEIPFSSFKLSNYNLLKGVTIATEIAPEEDSFVNYILVNGTQGTGFYRLSASGLLAAGKAYLQLPASVAQSRKTISISYDDNITGITEVESNEFDNTYFRLDGVRQVNPSRKGIYMKNGKKVIVK